MKQKHLDKAIAAFTKVGKELGGYIRFLIWFFNNPEPKT